MKSAFLSAIFLVAIGGSALAQACHYNPECIAKRDGVSLAVARKQVAIAAACTRSAGYPLSAWASFSVPAGPADKIRACLTSHGQRI